MPLHYISVFSWQQLWAMQQHGLPVVCKEYGGLGLGLGFTVGNEGMDPYGSP